MVEGAYFFRALSLLTALYSTCHIHSFTHWWPQREVPTCSWLVIKCTINVISMKQTSSWVSLDARTHWIKLSLWFFLRASHMSAIGAAFTSHRLHMSLHHPSLHLWYVLSEAWCQLQSPSPTQASRLSPHLAALSQGRKAFQSEIPAWEEQELGLFHRLLVFKWQNVFVFDHRSVREYSGEVISECLRAWRCSECHSGAGSCKQLDMWQESVTNHVVWQGDLLRIQQD